MKNLDVVIRAVEFAYQASQCVDEGNAAKNLAEEIEWSPLTRELEKAYTELLAERYATQGTFPAKPLRSMVPVSKVLEHAESMGT